MHPDDLAIDTTFRPGDLRAFGIEPDVELPEDSRHFVRAMAIGVPLAILMWTGIGLAIFQLFFQR